MFSAKDIAAALDEMRNRVSARVRENGRGSTDWLIAKYADEHLYELNKPFDLCVVEGNLLLNEGIQLAEDLLIGAGGTVYSNANAYIGVGDGNPTALTGTLTLTNGSASVTGSSTIFTSELTVGDYLVGADGLIYTVTVIGSNTALTIGAVYAGTTAAGATVNFLLRELASQTGVLAASNKTFKAMESTFPSRSSQTLTFKSVFASGDANYAWREFSIVNGSSNSGTNLNRKVSYQGVKASGQAWTVSATVVLS